MLKFTTDLKRPKPVVLIVLDGWGYSEDPQNNAIYAAKKPHWDRLWENGAHGTLACSGLEVGLPPGQMGNSEVGHMNMGAGRVVYQDFTRITKAIEEKTFFTNPVFLGAIEMAKTKVSAQTPPTLTLPQGGGDKNWLPHKGGGDQSRALHVLGLLSPGGIHSHEEHLFALIRLAAERGLTKIYLHAFLDGRDMPPKSAGASIERAEALFQTLGCGRVASLIGRYYAMDRDKRWDRTEAAYRLLVEGEAVCTANTAQEGLQAAYARGETDEFVRATAISDSNGAITTLQEGDVAVFMNFRADRARQLTRALTQKDFAGFARKAGALVPPFEKGGLGGISSFVTLTQYAQDLPLPCAFAPVAIKNGMGEYLASLGLKQLRIAETEKYAHVTFFFSGGIEQPYPGEDRILVPSPSIATYDLKPEMSAFEVTEKLCEAIHAGQYDFIVCNFANPDMVGHTGDYAATVKAIEAVDTCLGKVVESLKQQHGELLITADHGNAEYMYDAATGQAHTAHTLQPVPFIYWGQQAEVLAGYPGVLADIAPTLLYMMHLNQPTEMTGRRLMRRINT